MGIIWQNIKILGTKKSKIVMALFDSGAYFNYIRSENIFDRETPDDIGFHIFEGTKESILADGRFKKVDWVRFKEVYVNGITIKEPKFLIMKDLTWDAIIGAELMQQVGIILDTKNEKIVFKRKVNKS